MKNYRIKSFMLIFNQLQRDIVHDPRAARLKQLPLPVRQYRRLSSYLMSLHSNA
jgi:hypothetical protein